MQYLPSTNHTLTQHSRNHTVETVKDRYRLTLTFVRYKYGCDSDRVMVFHTVGDAVWASDSCSLALSAPVCQMCLTAWQLIASCGSYDWRLLTCPMPMQQPDRLWSRVTWRRFKIGMLRSVSIFFQPGHDPLSVSGLFRSQRH